jgi:hypothetical protein
MKRLVRKADEISDVQKLLKRIDNATHNLKDIYYVLFDNLNALFDAYPNLYKEMQMLVKLPTNDDAKDVMQFYKDLHDVLDHLSDKQYLESYINPPIEEKEEQNEGDDLLEDGVEDPDFDNKVDEKFDNSIEDIDKENDKI